MRRKAKHNTDPFFIDEDKWVNLYELIGNAYFAIIISSTLPDSGVPIRLAVALGIDMQFRIHFANSVMAVLGLESELATGQELQLDKQEKRIFINPKNEQAEIFINFGEFRSSMLEYNKNMLPEYKHNVHNEDIVSFFDQLIVFGFNAPETIKRDEGGLRAHGFIPQKPVQSRVILQAILLAFESGPNRMTLGPGNLII